MAVSPIINDRRNKPERRNSTDVCQFPVITTLGSHAFVRIAAVHLNVEFLKLLLRNGVLKIQYLKLYFLIRHRMKKIETNE